MSFLPWIERGIEIFEFSEAGEIENCERQERTFFGRQINFSGSGKGKETYDSDAKIILKIMLL